MPKLLLLSNSTMPGTPFFTWPRPWVKNFLGPEKKELVFIPFAAVTLSFDQYEDVVRNAFEAMHFTVRSIHNVSDKAQAIRTAAAIVVGGGNTFALLARLYQEGLLDLVREKVLSGTPYIGWSAGANLACPTIMTTNDMPVVAPPSFEALNLIPFQINPHYHELKFQGQGGETRRERLEEFVVMNPHRKVIGLPEGMLLQREGNMLMLHGEGTARLYQSGHSLRELNPGTDVSALLKYEIQSTKYE